MPPERIFRDLNWSPEDRARHKAIREKFQRERPSLKQLIESGDYFGPIPAYIYFELRVLTHTLKKAREAAGLTLADVAQRSGVDEAALSRLENVQDNPTVEALMRYASAIGKKLSWTIEDLTPSA